jgi:hypothetical protein
MMNNGTPNIRQTTVTRRAAPMRKLESVLRPLKPRMKKIKTRTRIITRRTRIKEFISKKHKILSVNGVQMRE